jgi:catechol 2,3-dioxygenase-like lactoylglutathione lyase family enzyme
VPFLSVDHVQLAMPPGREDEARQFYAGILGFKEVAKPSELASRGGCWFRSGSIALHLGIEADFRPARKAHPALTCDDYSALLERLEGHGIEIMRDNLALSGKAHCYIADPFGNRLELIEH